MSRKTEADQFNMFPELVVAEPEKTAVGPAKPSEDLLALGRALPADIRLGGSTWSFPGWSGLVYDGRYSEGRLAREGLAAYGQHPLLRCVGIDRTHYAPIEAADFADYAGQVPDGFRFVVKAHEACTLARFPDWPRYGSQRGELNAFFLDPVYAAEQVVRPFAEGLGEKAGALVFQFAPQDLGTPEAFADDLHRFLDALPRGPVYGVELRNRELLTPAYAAALADTGACHCHNVHSRMPDIRTQARLAGTSRPGTPATLIRWLLAPGMTYEAAGRLYAPFDRLVSPDRDARRAIADLAREAHVAGRPLLCTVNNNAEGSAPLSIEGLAREILARIG